MFRTRVYNISYAIATIVMKTENHYCFEISFPGVAFDSYMPRAEKVKAVHHAHLFPDRETIDIYIYFEPSTDFGGKLSRWVFESDWDAFGKSIVAEIDNQNDRLQRLDFTHSKLMEIKSTMDAVFVVLTIDTFQAYWLPNKELQGTGEFYLNESGFDIVKHFYAPLWGFNGEYKISRRNGMDVFYKIGNSMFRPEFFFESEGSVNERENRIIKKPKIQFQYPADLALEEAMYIAEIARNLISFYSHTSIDYTTSKVYLKEYTVITRRISKRTISNPMSRLSGLGNNLQLHVFLNSDWNHLIQKENSAKLGKIVELFLQSLLVDGSSKFLLYWTILEICSKAKPEEEKFESRLSKKEERNKFNEAFEVLTEIIHDADRAEFKKRWDDTTKQMMNKPMAGALLKFLHKEGLDPSIWPISLKELKDMRNRIVHGSTNEISSHELRRANILLYRVAGILILKHLGIPQWKLDTSLK